LLLLERDELLLLIRPELLLLDLELDEDTDGGGGAEDRLLEALEGVELEERLRVGAAERERVGAELDARLRVCIGREVVRDWVVVRAWGELRRTVLMRVVGVEFLRILERLVAPGERTELTLLRPELRTELVLLGTYFVSLPES
jgi:hypothetical protein